jgi:hypothetical protein
MRTPASVVLGMDGKEFPVKPKSVRPVGNTIEIIAEEGTYKVDIMPHTFSEHARNPAPDLSVVLSAYAATKLSAAAQLHV